MGRGFGWMALLILALAALGSERAEARTSPLALCVAKVRAGDTPATMLRDDSRYDCRRDQTAHGAGDFWVRSVPLAAHADVISMASLWQDRTTIWAIYADGAVFRTRYDDHGASRRLQLGAVIAQPLPRRTVPLVRLLWHVEGATNNRAVVAAVRLDSAAAQNRMNLILAALYAAFGGLCVSLFIYNLTLWAALRHSFQLTYCGMVAALAGYAFTSSGALAWALPAISNNDRLRLSYLLLTLSAVGAIAFARRFFEPRVFAGGMGRLSAVVKAMLLVTAILFAALAPWQALLLDRLYAASYLGLLAVAIGVLWRAWTMRSNYLWVFAIAWAVPIVLAAVRIGSGLRLIRWGFWIDNSTLVAMTVEALASSLAIAYRIRLLSRERDEAREQETAARTLADTDPLTGLLNRRAFLREAIGGEAPRRLILADIDHFKRVNETLGHDGGDEVLRLVARALRGAAPKGALVARLGGEEFAILADHFDEELARRVLDRVRDERMPFDISVTASLGTATGRLGSDADWAVLYRRADRALYDAKAAGRDRIRDADRERSTLAA